VPGDGLTNVAGTEFAALERAFPVEDAGLHPLLVIKDREIPGARQVVFLELKRSADIDHLVELGEVDWE
jgi:hypothetical protein